MDNVTLELAEEAFSQWRTQRSSQSEPIPDIPVIFENACIGQKMGSCYTA